jgi:hypothetical protein
MGILLKNLIRRRVGQDARTDHAYRVTDKVNIPELQNKLQRRIVGIEESHSVAKFRQCSSVVHKPFHVAVGLDDHRSPLMRPLSALRVRWWALAARGLVKCDRSNPA